MVRENLALLPSASSCAFPSSPLGQLWHTLNQLVKQAENHTGNKKRVCISKGSESTQQWVNVRVGWGERERLHPQSARMEGAAVWTNCKSLSLG